MSRRSTQEERRDAAWKVGQLAGVGATVAFLVGFVTAPDPTLDLLWNLAIPLLPLTFLINAGLWRNLCPLASLNMLGNRIGPGHRLGNGAIPAVGGAGIALLFLMVPARRFLFNNDGIAMTATVSLVAVAALVLGVFYDAKAGFCNALCPVLPVERLYGQHPLVDVANPRCRPCTGCTIRGCIDLGPRQSVAQTLGAASRSHAWLLTGFGAFAAMFPGFVAAYYTVDDVPLAAAGSVYLHVASWAIGSWVVAAAVVRILGLSARVAVPVLGALAVGIYYWFATPVVVEAVGSIEEAIPPLRVALLAVVTLWLWRALRTSPRDHVPA